MKKFGLNKRNPNPPWPDEQPVIVIPPGSNAASVGMPDSRVRVMNKEILDSAYNMHETCNMSNKAESISENGSVAGSITTEKSSNGSTRNETPENSFKAPKSNVRYPQRNSTSPINEAELYTSVSLGQRQVKNQNSDRLFPIMGLQENEGISISLNDTEPMMSSGGCFDALNVNGYLCNHIKKYVKIEFVFGEQTHVEKTGILRDVGRNFVVIREMGTNNDVVCSINKIKFITIYNMNENNTQ